MNKKFLLSMILIFILVFNSTLILANTDDKSKEHWVYKFMHQKFLNMYLDKIVDKFDPDLTITKGEFLRQLNALYSEEFNPLDFDDSRDPLTRREAVKFIIDIIEKHETVVYKETKQNKFKDLKSLNSDYVDSIMKAYNLGLISGYSEDKFAPFNKVTEAQAAILLQRISDMYNIDLMIVPFKVKESKRVFDHSPTKVKELNDKVLVTVTVEFPTSGYRFSVDKIAKGVNNVYNIYLNVISPDANGYQLQVITYKSITIEIDKSDLNSDSYSFKVMNDKITNKNKEVK